MDNESNLDLRIRQQSRIGQQSQAQARGLGARIGVVTVIVTAELGALSFAMESWAAGHTGVLPWVLGFQLVSFLLALTVSLVTPARPIPRIRRVALPFRSDPVPSE